MSQVEFAADINVIYNSIKSRRTDVTNDEQILIDISELDILSFWKLMTSENTETPEYSRAPLESYLETNLDSAKVARFAKPK
ncbi:hypothetical protein LOAG_12820 [Loa loa]|uniref:Acyl carrier protein n=1 Tax=Loa loa TaxID=7209 RepID=A0A1I7VQJ0_LOALO|nr:hypothetical protein LOAG_12820 [Loa loa]EFO15688.1 hypothetical protein LOAG_12820 [Loa loa]